MDNKILTEGKSRQVLQTENPDQVIVLHKDNETAYNGIKRATVPGKGVTINAISAILYELLEKNGVPTHFIKVIDEQRQLCRCVTPIRLEFIVRNLAAGDMTARLGIPTGTPLKKPIFECCYKDDKLDDPFINTHYAIALGISTAEELAEIEQKLAAINTILTAYFLSIGIRLVDFKVEFGRASDGTLLMCDELSPDSCRLWDAETRESLDRDRFRYDLGKVGESYEEVLHRMQNKKSTTI